MIVAIKVFDLVVEGAFKSFDTECMGYYAIFVIGIFLKSSALVITWTSKLLY
jgi:hypothetical protein